MLRSAPGPALSTVILLVLFFSHITAPKTFAATPPKLFVPKTVPHVGCDRTFQVEGKTYALDSPSEKDAEGLRPFFQEVPTALDRLHAYQNTRTQVQNAAYVGTAGIAILLLGTFASRYIEGDARNTVRAVSIWGGGLLAVSSLAYGVSTLQGNERKLDQGVSLYNAHRPEKQIYLQAEVSF
jgi:hypothetical protein